MLLFVLNNIAIQFLVKGLLRPVLPLRKRGDMFCLLLPALGSGQVLTMSAILRAVFLGERFGLAVFLLFRLDDVAKRRRRTALSPHRPLLKKEVVLLQL